MPVLCPRCNGLGLVRSKEAPALQAAEAGTSLVDSRKRLLAGLDDGTTCECCGQFARKYKRKLNANMLRFLVSLFRRDRTGRGSWHHFSECTFTARDYAYLEMFELAEMQRERVEGQKSRVPGMWRITAKGRRFVAGEIRVPRHVFVFDNRRLGFSDDSTSAKDAVVDAFDYDELMKPIGGGFADPRPGQSETAWR